ncbi:daf-6 [Cordylochernes scorpioides]|uniref:Daf-6 n=1 Tax=Cordylochernes scorpioides TaxID=51811 RepID=A0ABY6K058_9ARAC|nr:daf-6 [Cordylochernes scorpioides]
MDDTFMLITAWHQTDPKLPLGQRMEGCFSHVGVSITITSLTNLIAFLVGVITPFPAVYYFCIYITASILSCYIFQVTFFAGAMALFGRLEERGHHCIVLWSKVAPMEVTDGKVSTFTPPPNKNGAGKEEQIKQKTICEKFFEYYLGYYLCKPVVQVVVIVVFVAYLVLAAYGITLMKEDFNRKTFVRTDSYAFEAFDILDRHYLDYQYRYQVVLNETMDFSNPKVQQEVEDMHKRFEELPNMASSNLTKSWLRAYLKFLAEPRMQDLLNGYNVSTKEGFIRGLHEVFFRLPLGKLFKRDVLFNEDFTEILTTRYFFMVHRLAEEVDKKTLYQNILEVKKSLPFQVAVFHPRFPFFEKYSILKTNTLQSIGIAAVVLLVTVFIFHPNLACSLSVGLSVVSLMTGVMGFMSLWDIRLDTVISISLVLNLGLSVDYAAHVSYAYVTCKENDPKKRLIHSLQCTAIPILQSCLSTFVGISPFFFFPAYTFLGTCKNIFLLLVFAVFHSIFLLPIFLTVGFQFFSACAPKETLKTQLANETATTNPKPNYYNYPKPDNMYAVNEGYVYSEFNPKVLSYKL